MATPKKWKEIYVLAHKMIQITIGSDRAIQATFAAYNTDGTSNFVCPYIFIEKTPTSVTREIDDLLVGLSKLPHSKSVIGVESVAIKYSPVGSIGLNELTGVGGPVSEGNFGVAQQRHDNFLVRINIDLVDSRDGQSLRGFMLPFSGAAPKDLVGRALRGVFAPARTIASMTPWARATRVMDDYFQGF
jgi:hypothetical protein